MNNTREDIQSAKIIAICCPPLGIILSLSGYCELDHIKAITMIIAGCILLWLGGLTTAYLIMSSKKLKQ